MIIADRFKECADNLALALNPVDGSEEFDLDGQKINLEQFLPIVFRHLGKVVLKNQEKSEEIFNYIVESIHYFTGITDEPPNVTYMTPDEMHLQNSGHDEPKVKIKLK